MSVTKASLWRRAVLTLVAGSAMALPLSAQADYTHGLSVRVGIFVPSRGLVRDITDFGAWGAGIDYKLPFKSLLNGEHWSTSVSADFHYSGRVAGVLRSFPVSINQIYTFEEQNGRTPFAGFCVTANTFGTTGTLFRQPTVTRFGAGLILGVNLTNKFYLEGRYEWIDKHGAIETPEGFRGYLGYRF